MLLDMTRTAKFERWSSVAKKGGHRVYLHTHWSFATFQASLSLLSRVTSQSTRCSCEHVRPRRAGLWSCDWSGAATKEHVPTCCMVSAHNREPQQEGASISSDKETNKPVKTTARGWPFLPSFSWGGVQAIMCCPHIVITSHDQVYMVTGHFGEERG